jgi:putative inorganic carbon (HCO3(-)) transporter
MRDVLMVLIVCGALPLAVRHTWFGVLLWTWISIMNPHKLAWGFAMDAPFAAAAAGATLLSLVFNRDKLRMPWEAPVVTLMFFIVWMCFTTALAFFPVESSTQLNKVLKIQLMTLIAFAALRERKHLELFVWVNALSIGFYGLKGGLFTLRDGGTNRVWGPPGGFIEGNNELGLALIMTIPLLNYLRVTTPSRLVKLGLIATMVLSAVAALGTQSRGAFLAIIAMGAVLWLRSSHKLVSGLTIVVVGASLLSFMPETWVQRMETIRTYENDSSAMGRINAWQTAFNLANDRVTGGGYEMYNDHVNSRYSPVRGKAKAAHSIYFQVLGEHGWPGLFLFLLIGLLTFRMAGKIRKQARLRPETEWLHPLASMVQVSMVGYAVGGAFLSLAYFDLPYNIVVMVVVAWRWLQERSYESEPQPRPEPARTVGRRLLGRRLADRA